MINLPLFPIIIPFFFAILLLFFPKKVKAQRVLTIVAIVLNFWAVFYLLAVVKNEGVQSVTLGSWPVPFGITMVSDMLSVLLVLSSTIITLFVVMYSFRAIGEDREKFYYYPAILFMLTGINGAFTTGDIFNLFVFFEVFLMSSYVLIVLGGEKTQLRESIKYLLVNVISSAIFVVTIALLYSVVGTLNMADISLKIGETGQPGIVTVIAILFLVVFGMKAAVFPLHFWLPGSYTAPPIPVLTLFGALLTKVGVYAIMRTYNLFFIYDKGYTHEVLLILSLLTIVAGCIGALATFDIKQIMIYNIVIAVGVILFGASLSNETALTGSVFYLIHDILIKGALFLLIGVISAVTGTTNLRKMGGLMKTHPALGWMYLLAAFGLAGIPPLSGFAGKLLIVQGGFAEGELWGSIIILISGLAVLLSAIRIFIYAFWGESKPFKGIEQSSYKQLFTPAVILTCITILYGLSTEFILPYMQDAGQVLHQPSIYIDAVIKE